MLHQKRQWLKIIAAIFSVTVFLGLMAPVAFAEGNFLIYPTHGKLVQGFHQGHYAYDIADPSAPAVIAAQSGKVVKAFNECDKISYGCEGGYGNRVVVDHGNGLKTLYAHLGSVAVKEGDTVSQGETLGQMGRSGNVKRYQGIHLHFEVMVNGVKIQPSYFYKGF